MLKVDLVAHILSTTIEVDEEVWERYQAGEQEAKQTVADAVASKLYTRSRFEGPGIDYIEEL